MRRVSHVPKVKSVPRVARALKNIPKIEPTKPHKMTSTRKTPINTMQPAREPNRPKTRMDMSAPSPEQAGPYQGLGPAPFGEGHF
jgi:hypothetical protein